MNWRALFWWRPPCLLRTVIINRIADEDGALRGVLFSSRGAWLTLKDVTVLHPSAEPAAIPGDVVIHRSQVAFIQVLP